MEVADLEMVSQGEDDSPLHPEQLQAKAHTMSSLGRQTSIYSLTLDEFQNTMCESGKSFGSMNMDEFLNSIWTAEENQAQAQAQTSIGSTAQLSLSEPPKKGIAKQPSLPRQGSLTIPAPLSQKTVDEVWAEIHRSQQDQQQSTSNIQNLANPTQQRQLTFGEMTLEDFLVRAGVVREQTQPAPIPLPQQPYGSTLYPNSNASLVGTSTYASRPVMNLGVVSAGGSLNVTPYQPIPRPAVVGEVPSYPGAVKRGGGYPHQSGGAAPLCYGERIGNASGVGYGQMQPLAVASPVSPVSPEGLGSQADGTSYAMDMAGISGGRKRMIDGPIEKVVERRQRRMIKNRESAARSRARKQAYTVELEAELNQLKEENAHLKQAMAEMERKRRQQLQQMEAESKAQKACGRLRMLRRSTSNPL